MQPFQLKFLLQSVYDVLPTQANLHRWNLTETADCSKCGRKGTLEHVLSSCRSALADGRYTWRHNQVLREIAHTIETARKSKKRQGSSKQVSISFVKEGQTGIKTSLQATAGLLYQANDWSMTTDLDSQLTFPIVTTQLRPDIVLWSISTKKVVIIELTVPWEERCEEANERKKAKYEDLLAECRQQGWKTWNFPVEVGCRGFPAQSLGRTFSALGIKGREKRSAIQKICKAAEKSSCWLWIKRESSWKPTNAHSG